MRTTWFDLIEDIKYKVDVPSAINFVFILASGIIAALIISSLISKLISHRASAHYTILIRRLLYYSLLLTTLVVALPISPLNFAAIGAVLTLAIGFAARSPLSNIINGLFLVFETPFVIGDEIEINKITGHVTSIDLLAVKILTCDNIMVRFPNELIFIAQLNNLSRHRIRRLDTIMHISYQQDITSLEKILHNIANGNKKILETPAPFMSIKNFNEVSVEIQYSFWLTNKEFDALKTILQKEIFMVLQQNNIKLPELALHSFTKDKIAPAETILMPNKQ